MSQRAGPSAQPLHPQRRLLPASFATALALQVPLKRDYLAHKIRLFFLFLVQNGPCLFVFEMGSPYVAQAGF